MDVYQFFKKYSRDMLLEQKENQGQLPLFVPSMKEKGKGIAIWGDAATIIPWNMYRHYGDTAILKQNYLAMRSWVDWIGDHTQVADLWVSDFQLGDWLALDNSDPNIPAGKTDPNYIASVYYMYSAQIVANTAEILNKEKDSLYYEALARWVKQKIHDEYITKAGRIAIDTQTAKVLALKFNLVDDKQKKQVVSDLVDRIHQDHDHLTTGFVGTAFLNQVLSANGQHDLATKIFFNDDEPSWLYEVKMGATTIWERWNSVLPDGKMNPVGMNSLNHYSFGAIASWVYEYLLGFRNYKPGMQRITFAPLFTSRLKQVSGKITTSYGPVEVAYQLEKDAQHRIVVDLQIPFGASLEVDLPRSDGAAIEVNGHIMQGSFNLEGGNYQISYQPSKSYIETYSLESTPIEILNNFQLKVHFKELLPALYKQFDHEGNAYHLLGNLPLSKAVKQYHVDADRVGQFAKVLEQTIKE